MGSGIQGGGLTGGPAQASSVIAPAGQSAVIAGPLGAGATDVVTKAGSTQAEATVNATAALFQVLAGIGGTEVAHAFFLKTGLTFPGAGTNAIKWDNNVAGNFWFINGNTTGNMNMGFNTTNLWTGRFSDLGNVFGTLIEFNPSGSALAKISGLGQLDQSGTDSSGSPGAAVINKPTGKSAIAIAAASVVITNSICAATSRVMITPQSRDATCKELIAVPGAGSFTVSGSAVATAAVVFSWEVSNLL